MPTKKKTFFQQMVALRKRGKSLKSYKTDRRKFVDESISRSKGNKPKSY